MNSNLAKNDKGVSSFLSAGDYAEAEQHVVNGDQLDNVLFELKELSLSGKRGTPRWNKLTKILFESCESLVGWRILKKYNQFVISHRKKSGHNITEDLQNEAWLAIMANIEKYDPKRGRATTFIVNYTEKGAQEAVYRTTGMSQYYTMTYLQIQKAIEELKSIGMDPSIPAIQTKTGLPVSTIKNTLETAERLLSKVSYDTNGFEETSLDGKVVVDAPGIAKEVTDDAMKIDVNDAINSLSGCYDVPADVVQAIIRSKFYDEDTHNEIAIKYNLPVETVSRVVSKKKKELIKKLEKGGYAPSKTKNEKQSNEIDDGDNVSVKSDAFVDMLKGNDAYIVEEDLSGPDIMQGRPHKEMFCEAESSDGKKIKEDFSEPDMMKPSRKKGAKNGTAVS